MVYLGVKGLECRGRRGGEVSMSLRLYELSWKIFISLLREFGLKVGLNV